MNGIHAVNALKNGPVDIILTDIRMDGMDGLELTRYVRLKYPAVKVILISAYREFEYAREAINAGAFAYILKPVRENELMEKVKQVIDVIKSEKESQHKITQYDIDEMSRLLSDYMSGSGDSAEKLHEKIVGLNERYLEGKFHTFIVEVSNINLKKAIQERISNEEECISFLLYPFVAGAFTDENNTSAYRFLNFLTGLALQFEGSIVRICTGPCDKGLKGIKRSLDRALKVYNYSFLYDCKGVTTYEKYKNNTDIGMEQRFVDFSEIFKMEGVCKEDMIRDAERVFNLYRENCTDVNIVKNQCIHLLTVFSKHMSKYGISMDKIYEERGYPETIQTKSSLREIESYMKWVLESTLCLIEERDIQMIRPIVKRALDYAKKKIGDMELSVEKTANEIGVSYAYLSKSFKEDLGINFTDYINKYRIEISKKYLRETDMRIYEICHVVGVEPKYFHYLFKKYENKTPREYQTYLMNGESDRKSFNAHMKFARGE